MRAVFIDVVLPIGALAAAIFLAALADRECWPHNRRTRR